MAYYGSEKLGEILWVGLFVLVFFPSLLSRVWHRSNKSWANNLKLRRKGTLLPGRMNSRSKSLREIPGALFSLTFLLLVPSTRHSCRKCTTRETQVAAGSQKTRKGVPRSRKDSHEEKEVQERDHKTIYELLYPSLSCTCTDPTLISFQKALRTDPQGGLPPESHAALWVWSGVGQTQAAEQTLLTWNWLWNHSNRRQNRELQPDLNCLIAY